MRSSSATRILAGASIIGVSPLLPGRGGRKGECEDGAGAVGPVGGTKLAPVRQDNLAGDRQAQPGPLGLGRVERLEQVADHIRRQSGTGVGHASP